MQCRIALILIVGAFLISSCSDQSQSPTEPAQPSARTKPPVPVCSTLNWLNDLKTKNALVFSGSLLTSANDKVTAIYNQCNRGALTDAKKKAIFFVDWMFKKFKVRQTKSSARAVDLVNVTSAVLSGVGLQSAEISPAIFGPTGGIGAYDNTQPGPTTVTTLNQDAGVQLAGTETGTPAFAEPTLITVIQLPDSPQLTGQGAPPGDQQFPPFYDFNAINASGTHQFQADAASGVISICLRSDITYPDPVVLGHTTYTGAFEFLPSANPIAGVTCDAPVPAISALPSGLKGLAVSAWHSAMRYVGPLADAVLLPPALAAAVRTGIASGSARSLSPVGETGGPASTQVFLQASSGLYHSCALVNDGTVQCWGDNEYGQAPASQAPSQGSFTEVSAGAFHTCARVDDGTIGCWGNNTYEQAPASLSAPTGTTFTQVTGGGNHSCALVSDGTLHCWGQNSSGEAPASRTPAEGVGYAQVSAGGAHTCVLQSDKGISCWGANDYGQAPATKVAPAGSTFEQLSAGYFHTCALVSDGTVACWGGDFYGETPASPVLPPAGTTFREVSATLYHTCALVSDGSVRCWGNNADGFSPPTQAPPEGNTFTQVSAAFTHNCGLLSDGNLACWGGLIGQTTGFHIFTP